MYKYFCYCEMQHDSGKHWILSAFGDNQKMYPGEKKTTGNWSICDIFALNIKLIQKIEEVIIKNKKIDVSAKPLNIHCFLIFFASLQ